MGTDIYSITEVRDQDGAWKVLKGVDPEGLNPAYNGGVSKESPFQTRNYIHFAFLAGVRQRFNHDFIDIPRGFPEDMDPELDIEIDYDFGDHSATHVYLTELLEFNYDQALIDDATRANDIEGILLNTSRNPLATYRDLLGGYFFDILESLKTLGKPENVRILIWFNG